MDDGELLRQNIFDVLETHLSLFGGKVYYERCQHFPTERANGSEKTGIMRWIGGRGKPRTSVRVDSIHK